MILALLITIGLAGVGVGFTLLLAAGSAQKIVEDLAPEYASRLFVSSGVEAVFSRTPVRFSVLFSESIPDNVKSWIDPIRALAGVFLVLLVCFLFCLFRQYLQ